MSTDATRSDLKAALRLLDNHGPKFDNSEDALEYQRLMELRRDIEVDDGDDAEDLSEFCEHRLVAQETTTTNGGDEDGLLLVVGSKCRHCGEKAEKVLIHSDFDWEKNQCLSSKNQR